MIPRLPPIIIVTVASAVIYGAKHVLDRYEPKAIGPPGSSEHAEKLFKYRRNVKRAGLATAVSGLAYVGYLAYESRKHRSSPAVLVKNKTDDFYKDQYSERDRNYNLEKEHFKKLEREHEVKAQKHLENIRLMEEQTIKNKQF